MRYLKRKICKGGAGNELGVCPSHLLFDKIQVKKCEDVNVVRSINNYQITVDREMPEGVELIEKL